MYMSLNLFIICPPLLYAFIRIMYMINGLTLDRISDRWARDNYINHVNLIVVSP